MIEAAEQQRRLAAAEKLLAAIADCEEEDAIFVMVEILQRLTDGAPIFGLSGLEEEAESWATFCTTQELIVFGKALTHRIRRAPLGGSETSIKFAAAILAQLKPAARAKALALAESEGQREQR